MGVVKLFSHLLTAWVAFLHPCFASFKALSHRPVSEPDLERWVKYWAVLSVLVGTEYALEWLVSWVPFYWEVKTLFVLYLALPQTQGSTFVYDSYLAPYFTRNEAAIDAGIASAHSKALAFAGEQLQTAWRLAGKFINQVQAAQTSQPGDQRPPTGSPVDAVANLWRTYGPTVISGLNRASPFQTSAKAGPQSTAPSSQNAPAQGSAVPPPPAEAYTRTPYVASDTE